VRSLMFCFFLPRRFFLSWKTFRSTFFVFTFLISPGPRHHPITFHHEPCARPSLISTTPPHITVSCQIKTTLYFNVTPTHSRNAASNSLSPLDSAMWRPLIRNHRRRTLTLRSLFSPPLPPRYLRDFYPLWAFSSADYKPKHRWLYFQFFVVPLAAISL